MTNLPYVLLSRQSSLSRELDNVANNVANANTTGFRRDSYIFTEFVNALRGEQSISQARVGASVVDETQGELRQTGGVYDFAIEGDGYFGVLTPAGLRLTRAGAFLMNEQGLLATAQGHLLSGEGESPIAIPEGANSVSVAADGTVTADGAAVGRIEVFKAPAMALVREGDTFFRSDAAPAPLEFKKIRQGYLEASNVDPLREIARLIEVQRSFEMEQQILDEDSRRTGQAIEVLAGAR